MCGTDEEFYYSLDEAYTENADTWRWSTTNGTGSFSDAEIQNPIYTPSDQDRNNPDPIELVLTAEGVKIVCQNKHTKTYNRQAS